MAPRRTHRKSRSGCISCKQRRIKCDERGPPCGPCSHREIECTYSKASRTNGSIVRHGPTLAREPDSALSEVSGCTDGSKALLELELMNKWTSKTFLSFCCPELKIDYPAWQVLLPREGLKYPFLMQGLFSMAALEIAAEEDRENYDEYINIALEYHDSASQMFRAELSKITPDNQQAVLAFSIITMILSLALAQIPQSGFASKGLIGGLGGYFELVRGGRIITIQHWEGLTKCAILRNHDFITEPHLEPLEADVEAAISRLNILNEQRHNSTLFQTQKEKLLSITYHGACRKAVFHLGDSFQQCKIPVRRGHALAFPVLAGRDFVTAVENGDTVALLAVMYWGVLIDRSNNSIWWARSIGKMLVGEAKDLMTIEMDPLVRVSVAWAEEQVKQ